MRILVEFDVENIGELREVLAAGRDYTLRDAKVVNFKEGSMSTQGRKTRLDEGMTKKGGVNQGQPSTPRPDAPSGQGGNQAQNSGKQQQQPQPLEIGTQAKPASANSVIDGILALHKQWEATYPKVQHVWGAQAFIQWVKEQQQ